ncbi:hypothetical protein B566_EDAN007460 [Ephemera danica]|nr:hypothetical protein B566_EDAN007460 [Ephemera danica]
MSVLPSFYGSSWIYLVLVGALWGSTNPFMKIGSIGIEKIHANNPFLQSMQEFKFLFTRIEYMLPFIINQSGSVLYILSLQDSDLSLVVPVANSLTFLFTAIVGHWLAGEEKANKEGALQLET